MHLLKKRKYKGLLCTSIILFLVVNTAYFWEGKLGMYAMLLFLLMILLYVVAGIMLLLEIISAIKQKFRSRPQLLAIAIGVFVLITAYLKPAGLIDFDSLTGKDLLVAGREGVASCTTTFKLKEDNYFIERSICFGINEITGKYKIVNDTIWFSDVKLGRNDTGYYRFGVIDTSTFKNSKYSGSVTMFKAKEQPIGISLAIIKNELK